MNLKIPKSFQLETPRFLLRIPDEQDIPFVYSATKYPGFNDGMLWEPPAKKEELLEPLIRSIKAWEDEIGYSFTIIKKGTSNLIGRISIRRTEQENVWNVGFWTHPESQKKGVITECLKAVLKFGFEELSATKIEACHALWNIASEKVLKRNGMSFERYIEKGFKKHGKWVAENLLSIDLKTWRSNTN